MQPFARVVFTAFCTIGLVACGSGAESVGNSPPIDSAGLGVNASLDGRVPFPGNNPWNLPVDTASVDPASDALIASIGLTTTLHPDWGTTETNYGIPYIVVAGTTPKVPVAFDYADESDPGPYPIPADAPIEGGAASSGDRHILIIDRDHWMLYELYAAYPPGPGHGWTAGSGAIFDLNSNALRPAGWTSADAAGSADLPRARSLRRGQCRRHPSRAPIHRAADPPGVRRSSPALGQFAHRPEPARRWACASASSDSSIPAATRTMHVSCWTPSRPTG